MGVVSQSIELARAGDAPRALLRLWRHLAVHGVLEPGLDRSRCEHDARVVLHALQEDAEAPDVHPAAALCGIDGWLASWDLGFEPRPRFVAADDEDAAGWVVRRPSVRGGRAPAALRQPGQRAYWLRHHQVLPANHRGIDVEVRVLRADIARALGGDRTVVAAAGVPDGVQPDWCAEPPLSCSVLDDPERRAGTVVRRLEEAAQEGAELVVLPELTVDTAVRRAVEEWLYRSPEVSIALVVAGSFHEGGLNRSWILDGEGLALFRHDKLRPIRTTAGDVQIDEDIDVGEKLLLHVAPFGVVGVGICLDFCEEGDSPVRELWFECGPNLVLVPSMGEASTVAAHRRKAEALGRQHGTVVVVATQTPDNDACSGHVWVPGADPATGDPIVVQALAWHPA